MFFKRWLVLDETTVHKKKLSHDLFRKSVSRLYPGLKLSFEHNSARRNLLLIACFCGDYRLSLLQMDQKFKFGGNIGYGDSYLKFFFRRFKVFRLHTIVNYAAGAVRPHSGKSPGYCYMIGWGPTSCLLGHVTWLFFRLYVKLFLPSFFKSVDFCSRMSCIVLEVELANPKALKELKILLLGLFRKTLFILWKSRNPQNKHFGVQNICLEMCGTVEVWILMSSKTFYWKI